MGPLVSTSECALNTRLPLRPVMIAALWEQGIPFIFPYLPQVHPNVYPAEGTGDWTHMLAGPICFNKLIVEIEQSLLGEMTPQTERANTAKDPLSCSGFTFPPRRLSLQVSFF